MYNISFIISSLLFLSQAERLERKLEEIGTIHDVSVLRREWPSNETGGWGERPVVDGTRGGFYWQVRFLRNPGTYGGATFPPSSGDVYSLTAINTKLTGTGAQVVTTTVQDGSGHLDGGVLQLLFDGETTELSKFPSRGSLSNSNSDSVQNQDGSIAFNLDAIRYAFNMFHIASYTNHSADMHHHNISIYIVII